MFNARFARGVAIGVSVAMLLTGCASMPGDGRPQTALDRSVNQCIGSVVLGTIAGALIGAAVGHGNAGKGAIIGAGSGAVVCAIILAVNNAQDRKHIEEAQHQALVNTDKPYQTQFTGPDGQPRMIKASLSTETTPVNNAKTASPDGGVFVGPCRPLNTEITLPGQGTTQLSDVACRTSLGNWEMWGSNPQV